jgi:hypothetical protein
MTKAPKPQTQAQRDADQRLADDYAAVRFEHHNRALAAGARAFLHIICGEERDNLAHARDFLSHTVKHDALAEVPQAFTASEWYEAFKVGWRHQKAARKWLVSQ